MVYIVFFSIICSISYVMNRDRRRILASTLVVGLLMSLMIGLRSVNIGNDTQAYINIFKSANQYNSFFENDSRYEIGYTLLMRIIGIFTDNAHLALLIIAICTIMPVTYTIFRYSEIPWFSIALLFLLGFFTSCMNIVRQCLAMAIIFSGVPKLRNKKVLHYIICVLIATTIHSTAILALALVPFVYMDITNKRVFAILCLSVICTIAFPFVLKIMQTVFPQYAHYFSGSYFDGSGFLAVAMNLASTAGLLLGMIYYTDTPLNSKRMFKFGTVALIGESYAYSWSIVIFIALQILGFAANITDRIGGYFSLAFYFFLPQLSAKMKPVNRERFIALIVLLYLAKFIIVQIFRPEWNHILPYEFFWSK